MILRDAEEVGLLSELNRPGLVDGSAALSPAAPPRAGHRPAPGVALPALPAAPLADSVTAI
jgi:hypothetical protein